MSAVKELGLDVIFLKNFRPMSNLSFVFKLIERAAFNQIHGHLVSNNLYPVAQFAYRRNHSTDIALLKVMNDILLNMNKQHVTILVLLDTVDHKILHDTYNPLFLAALTIVRVIACYMAYRRISQDLCCTPCIQRK